MKKSNLDEMQEQKLLKLEHNGYWLACSALLLSIFVQIILGAGYFEIVGEVLVLLLICVYLVIGCLKNGIWDRRLKSNWKTNLAVSLLAGVFIAVFCCFYFSRQIPETSTLVWVCILPAIFTALLCFAALSVCMVLYKKRREQLDQE